MLKKKRNSEKARNKAKVVYLLSGLIKCGLCGAAYIGNSGGWTNRKGKKEKIYYYECGARDRTRTCSNRRIRKQILEDIVLNEIEKEIFAPEAQLLFIEKLFEFYKNQRGKAKSEIDYAKKEYARIQRAINNLLYLIEQGKATDSILKQLKQREKEKAVIEGELGELEKQESLNLNKEEVRAYIEHYYKQFIKAKKEKDDEKLKPIVQNFIEKVIIYEEYIEIILKISLGNSLVTDGGGEGYWTVTKTVKWPVKGYFK